MSDETPRLPYYPWYAVDYRASFKVQRLSWQARGLYREILDECWIRGHVPDDFNELALICRCDIKDVAEHWRYIKPLLREVPQSDGHLWESPRMEIERAEVGRRSEHAKKAAAARWAKQNDLDARALQEHKRAMPSYHSRAEQIKAAGVALRPSSCTCEPTRDVAPGTGTVFLRHADDCPVRRA